MNDYKINLRGVCNGKNSFSFKIKDKFFEAFAFSEVEYADMTAIAILNKNGEDLVLNLTIKGKVNKLLCDICTEELSVKLVAETNVIIKITDEEQISTDEVFYIRASESLIDMQQLIFELIILNLPKKRQHPLNNNGEATCNKEMINLIAKYTLAQEKSSDPRWDALKEIKIK